jgi:peptidoglycan/LPS O-acetylase OafA/YrhL
MLNRINWIDSLRGLAFFIVLIYHVGLHQTELSDWIRFITNQGEGGVQLFYVISAFTLFLSMQSRVNKEVEKFPLYNFFIRRFFRIAPMFYFMIIFYVMRDWFSSNNQFENSHHITIPNIISHVLFINGWNPYWINTLVEGGWSVAIEMPFYLLVPFLYKNIISINQSIWLTGIIFIMSKGLSAVLKKYPLIPDIEIWNNFTYYWLPNQFPVFLMGINLYFIYTKLMDYSSKKSTQGKTIGLLDTSLFTLKSINLLLILLLFLTIASLVGKLEINSILLIRGLCFIVLAIFLEVTQFPLLVNGFWRYLGKISYSAYLVHFQVLAITNFIIESSIKSSYRNISPDINFLFSVVLGLSGTMIIASITYHFIEVPGMNLGKKIILKRI